eukprot:c18269_g1_i2 orf=396-1148(-)
MDSAPSDISAQNNDSERKARINAIWEQLNAKKSAGTPKSVSRNVEAKVGSTTERTTSTPVSVPGKNSTPEWMVSLGFAHQKTVTTAVKTTKEVRKTEDKDSKEALMKIAASALAAAKDTSLTSKEGKLVVSEVRDFAGEEIKVTKLIDPNSKAAEELKRRQSSSGVDKLLQQIEKKQKINVLDKSRKDWTEFKEEKQIEEELESYKKSGDKYTDRVAFLQRSDLREYERERDARLSLQAKKPGDISYIED